MNIFSFLQSTLAGVPKMLSGKKYPQNVRALRLVVEELLHPLFGNNDFQTIDDLREFLDAPCLRSRTTKLWADCLIKPVLICMTFVQAERKANWLLHLSVVQERLPYFSGSGHVNFARYGLYYLRSMQRQQLKRFIDV